MKKILSILAATGLVATTSATVVACGSGPKDGDFKLPSFPKNIAEVQKSILSHSENFVDSLLKAEEKAKLLEDPANKGEEKQDAIMREIANIVIDEYIIENSFITRTLLNEAYRLEKTAKIKIWTINEEGQKIQDNFDLEDAADLNNRFDDLDDIIEDWNNHMSNLPIKDIDTSKTLQNLKEIRTWWLKGLGLKNLREEFTKFDLGKISFDSSTNPEQEKEILFSAIKSVAKDPNFDTTKIDITYYNINNESGYVQIADKNNKTYVNLVNFNFTVIQNTTRFKTNLK